MKKNTAMAYKGGFFHLYLFFIVTLTLVGIGTYYVGNKIIKEPRKVTILKDEYYVRDANGVYRYNGVDTSANSPYLDSISNFGGSSSVYRPDYSSNQPQETLPSPPQPIEATSTQPDITEPEPMAVTPIDTQSLDVFTSKINPKISFPVPIGGKVIENGTKDEITFTVSLQDSRKLIMYYEKKDQPCYNPVTAFPINPNDGVDFRIVHETLQGTLKNTVRFEQAYEEYGTYAGLVGFRADTCILTAVPIRLQIRSLGFIRRDINDAFSLMKEIIYNFNA